MFPRSRAQARLADRPAIEQPEPVAKAPKQSFSAMHSKESKQPHPEPAHVPPMWPSLPQRVLPAMQCEALQLRED